MDCQHPQSWRKPTGGGGGLTEHSCLHYRLWGWDSGREETSIRVRAKCCVQEEGVWVGTDRRGRGRSRKASEWVRIQDKLEGLIMICKYCIFVSNFKQMLFTKTQANIPCLPPKKIPPQNPTL